MRAKLHSLAGAGRLAAQIADAGVRLVSRESSEAARSDLSPRRACALRRGRSGSSTILSGIGISFFAAAVLLLPLAGCGSRASVGDAPAASMPFATGSTGRSFLNKVPDAPMNTAYGGTRHVHFSYKVNDVPLTLDYTEQVFSDGNGQFTVIPVSVAEPAMNAPAEDLFKLLQFHREGFLYRHRDFRIRDIGLFEQNYSVSDLGQQVMVCGRACAWLDIRRQSGGQSYYHVAVDVGNGLILRYEEFANSGQSEARVEFTEFTLTPDFTDVVFHTEQMSPQALDLGSDTTPTLGFAVSVPTLVPNAYQLEKSEQIDDGTRRWARLTYGDGAEQIFYLYSASPETPPPQGASGTGNHLHHPQRVVHVFHFGPWIVAQGDIDAERLIAVGKTDEAALLQMIQSALH